MSNFQWKIAFFLQGGEGEGTRLVLDSTNYETSHRHFHNIFFMCLLAYLFVFI